MGWIENDSTAAPQIVARTVDLVASLIRQFDHEPRLPNRLLPDVFNANLCDHINTGLDCIEAGNRRRPIQETERIVAVFHFEFKPEWTLVSHPSSHLRAQ